MILYTIYVHMQTHEEVCDTVCVSQLCQVQRFIRGLGEVLPPLCFAAWRISDMTP